MSGESELKKTITEGAIDSVFVEVTHSETLGLRNPSQLRLFHLKLDGVSFTDEGLYKCLRKNIGQYVFSRAEIKRYVDEGDAFSVALDAMQRVIDQKGKSPDEFGNMLGEILLYAFFEEKLNAPKIFSKMELNAQGTGDVYDGVHLLKLTDDDFQVVFGISRLEDGPEEAVENAFEKLKKANAAPSKGIPLVCELLFNRHVDDALAAQLDYVISPRPSSASSDTAYGIFLCYSIGLDKDKYDNATYKRLVESKMVNDLKYVLPKIQKGIADCGLTSRSVYVYIVPLDNATEDKTSIMNKIVGGGH